MVGTSMSGGLGSLSRNTPLKREGVRSGILTSPELLRARYESSDYLFLIVEVHLIPSMYYPSPGGV